MVRSVNELYMDLRDELRTAGISGYQIEARELVCCALQMTPEEFFAKKGMMVFDQSIEKVRELKKLRLSGMPVQYITGQWEFFGLTMDISQDTLIPRADTETLAQCGIDFLKNRDKGRVLDLCCGCGCIGIAVMKNVSEGINAVLADRSEEALQVARKNLVRHYLTARAATVVMDAMQPPEGALGRFNLIVCNPPYIPSGEIDTLDIEVQHEPRMALDGGEDGLDFYRAIAKNYKQSLIKGGALMFEVGLAQYEDVSGILQENGYLDIQVKSDLAGIERVVWGIVK